MKFGLGPGFEANVELLAIDDDFFHDLTHLIYLDGVDHVVLCLVVVGF